MTSNKIAIVITYFGNLPNYSSYFFASCAANAHITFFIFTDCDTSGYPKISNVIFIPFNLAQFNDLASTKIGLEIKVKSSYKLCDFKPMYGLIYADYLENYDFWGYCDIDIILGDLRKIFTDILLNTYSIISSHPQYMAGPFSIYKNIEPVNRLFYLSKDWKRIVSEPKVFLFDEASDILPHLWQGGDIFEVESEIESITHLVKDSTKNKEPFLFTNFVTERVPVEGRLIWEDGILKESNGKEQFIFHYIVYKGLLLFNVPLYDGSSRFYFNRYGFFLDSIKSYTYDWATAAISNFYGKAMKKVKSKIKF